MKTNLPIENPGWEQLARYLAGEARAAESEQVEAWAAQSDENRRELEQNRMLFDASKGCFELNQFNPEEAWQKVQQKINPADNLIPMPQRRNRKLYAAFIKYAAILIFAIFAGTAGYYLVTGLANEMQQVVLADEMTVREITLSDGTVVTLNKNSKLEYPSKFSNGKREVTITGEGFFDVQPDPDKPFIINAGNMQVKVLGTSFNVKAYPETESVEVTVETGIVQVTKRIAEVNEAVAEMKLHRGEKGILYNTAGKLEKSNNSDPNYIAWKTRNLIFNRTQLNDVIQYLEDIYHIDIQLEDNELEKLVLTAHFENKPHDFILNVIQLTFGLELTRENGAYVFSEKKELKN